MDARMTSKHFLRCAGSFAAIAVVSCATSNEPATRDAGADATHDATDASPIPQDQGVEADRPVTPAGWPGSVGCVAPAHAAGFYDDLSITVDGRVRTFDLYVPAGLRRPSQLLVNIQGWNSDENQQATLSDARAAADAKQYVVVLPRGNRTMAADPRGSGLSWNGGDCCVDSILDDVAYDDVHFIRALTEWVFADQCIDRSRVYATGMSNGGWMSHRLACQAADMFAAVAPVAAPAIKQYDSCIPNTTETECNAFGAAACGAHANQQTCVAADCSWDIDHCVGGCAWKSDGCHRRLLIGTTTSAVSYPRTIPLDGWPYACPTRPGGIPVMEMMGTRDGLYEGEAWMWGEHASFAETIRFWRLKNACSDTPTRTERYECPYDATCVESRTRGDCDANTACSWSGGACRSICDFGARCVPSSPTGLADVLTCGLRTEEALCAMAPACRWDATRVCTDCRDVVCEYYESCGSANVDVAACTNEGGQHCWPGESGRCSVALEPGGVTRVSANRLMWDFLSRHQLPAPRP